MENDPLKIQDYLSLGYLYLLLLGIVKDAIYYGFVGVNVMSFSNVLDVLLSPIAYLTSNIIVFLGLLLLIGWLFLQRRLYRYLREKKWYQKLVNVEKRDAQYAKSADLKGTIMLFGVAIGAFFLGTGIGGGFNLSNKLKSEELKIEDTLTFVDGEEEQVKIIGQNSNYVFYVQEGAKQVTISPINGVVKRIEMKYP